jgi:hypothetical protein
MWLSIDWRSIGNWLMRGDDQLPARRNSLRQVETYEVVRGDFDNIEKEATGIGTSAAWAFAALPVAVTLNVTLKTVTIADPNTAIPIWALMWSCYILGLFFAVSAYRQRGRLKRFMQDIRDRQVAPVAAKEITPPADLTAISDPVRQPSSFETPVEAEEER